MTWQLCSGCQGEHLATSLEDGLCHACAVERAGLAQRVTALECEVLRHRVDLGRRVADQRQLERLVDRLAARLELAEAGLATRDRPLPVDDEPERLFRELGATS